MLRVRFWAALLLLANLMCSKECETCKAPVAGGAGQTSSTTTTAPAEDDESAFVPLFNGENLEGWQGATDDYSVEDGLLICKEGAHGTLYTKEKYDDFMLKLEYKLGPGGNNGVGIRTEMGDMPPAVLGLEIQILDDSFPKYQEELIPVQFNGSIYGAVAAEQGHMKPVGQWNEMTIKADGPRITVTLNGTEILSQDMDEIGPKEIHRYDLVGLHNKTGFVAICGHRDRVEFRNIRVKKR